MRHFLAKFGRWWSLTAVAVTVIGVATGRCGSFAAIDGKRLERLAKDAGFQGMPAVSRNGPGTKVFLTGRTADNTSLVEIVSQAGVTFERFASGRPVIDDDGELVAWVTNLQARATAKGVVKALAFTGGEEIPIVFTNASPARFEFAPGGQYFLLVEAQSAVAVLPGWNSLLQPVPFLTPNATNMGQYSPACQAVLRTSSPTKPLFVLPNDFYASAIFTRSNQIMVSGSRFIFGTVSKPGRPDLGNDKAWALVFSQDGSTYRLTGQLDLSRFSGVLDLDPVTGMLLVRGKGDMFAEWGLFDPENRKYVSLGAAGAHGFFMDPAFSKYLESHW
jgi:hypothetical protein